MLKFIKNIFKKKESTMFGVCAYGEVIHFDPNYLKDVANKKGRDKSGRFIKGNHCNNWTKRAKNGRFIKTTKKGK